MRTAHFLATPEGQVDFDPPVTEDARLEVAAAREGQGGPSPLGEGGQGGLTPHQGQSKSSPHGERREVGSSPHEGQQQEGLVPPPALLDLSLIHI